MHSQKRKLEATVSDEVEEVLADRGAPRKRRRRRVTAASSSPDRAVLTASSERAVDYNGDFARINACVAQNLSERKDQTHQTIKQRLFPYSGSLCTFGSNDFGMIAQQEVVDECYHPALITSTTDQKFVQVQCGAQHSVCLTEDGNVWVWGVNDEGSLGSKLEETAYAPIPVTHFIPSSEQREVQGIPDPLFTWRDFRNAKPEVTDPMDIKIKREHEDTIIDVASGDTHCLALAASGRVYFWGSYIDVEGKNWADIQPFDDPRKVKDKDAKYFTGPKGKRFYPIHVSMLQHKAVVIACGFVHNAAIVEVNQGGVVRNKLVTWGMGEKGQLARPVFAPVKKSAQDIASIPKGVLEKDKYATFHVDKVESDYMPPKFAVYHDGVDRHVEKVACGGNHTLVLAKSDEEESFELFAAGLNNDGQLGISEGIENERVENKIVSDRVIPVLTKVEFFSKRGITISQIAAGQFHSLCVDSSGRRLFAFGRSDYGQLGHTDNCPKEGSFEVEPVEIVLEKNKGNPIIKEISCGSDHSFAVTADGDVWSWGSGEFGQLGIGKLEKGEDVETRSFKVDEDVETRPVKVDKDVQSRPVKVDVLNDINQVRSENDEPEYQKAKVLKVAGGSQSSALIAILK
ncbi:hypothetical protein CTEN210_18404 [Chaetoceros tenuissimus]|uniref:RCC1-like domain-containing protein n=1 Tax=Chaetoceros tenuissimus TaxID=426638 RepID=A0AAD3DCM4_9STRA|nr:hypothetical protein CTEN210_18404 [Chaetoceros tenuissimus]